MAVAKVKVLSVEERVWDPLSSPDWDREKHSKEAIMRIKRLGGTPCEIFVAKKLYCFINMLVCSHTHTHACRDLQAIYTDPLPGVCVVPEQDDITKVS